MENVEMEQVAPVEEKAPLDAQNAGESESERQGDSSLKAARIKAFEDRRQGKIERLRGRAEKKRKDGERLLKRADSISSFIPPGQPILVGHHSEKRHRRDLEKIRNATTNGFDSLDAAKRLEQRAASAEDNQAIFTEDPRAGEKLEEKISALEKKQALMKEVNKRIRLKQSLADLGVSGALETELGKPDFLGRIGYPDYTLKNNNANIRRLKARLEGIRKTERLPEPEEIERNGISIIENVDLNRVQIFFPGKPAEEVRKKLKSNGFRWSPFNGCWQRHRSAYATLTAREFLEVST